MDRLLETRRLLHPPEPLKCLQLLLRFSNSPRLHRARRPVDLNHYAGRSALGVDQFHGPGRGAAAEEALAFAQDHPEGHDAEFVDQLGLSTMPFT